MESCQKDLLSENPRSRSNWFLVEANTTSSTVFFESRTCPNISSGMSRQSLSPKRQTPNDMKLLKHAIVENGGNSPISWVLLWEARISLVDSLPESIRCVCSLLKNGDLFHEIYVAKSSNRISTMTTAALLRWKNVIQTFYPRNSTWKTSQMEWASAFPTDSKKKNRTDFPGSYNPTHNPSLWCISKKSYLNKVQNPYEIPSFYWLVHGFLSWPVIIPI